jgi:hypothetical protein
VAAPDAVPPLAAPPASPKVTKPPPPAVAVVPSPAGGPVSVDIPEQPSRRPVRVGMVNGTRCVTITETSSSEAGLASRQVTRCTSGAAADAGRSVPVSGHPESRSGCPCTAGAHTGTSDTGEQDTGEQPNGRRTKTNAKSKIGATGHDDDAPPVDAEEADPGATD